MLAGMRLLALALPLTLACGGGSDASTDSDAASTGASTGDPVPDPTGEPLACRDGVEACCCFEVDRSDPAAFEVAQRRPSVAACDPITITCAGVHDGEPSCPDGEISVETPEAVTCALTALHDGTPGRLRWRITDVASLSAPDPAWYEDVELHLRADRTAFVIEREHVGASLRHEDTRRVPLPAAELLATCLTQDAIARFGCLRTALDAPPDEVCIDAFADNLR
jgi:hypothetical protein